MKSLTYAVVMGIALLSISQSSLVTAQQVNAGLTQATVTAVSKSTIELINWADHVADLCNPLKLPVRYGKLLWSTGKAVYAGKENSYWKMAGVLAIPVIPWLLWRLWVKKVYNEQGRLYNAVRAGIEKHCAGIHAIANGEMSKVGEQVFRNAFPYEATNVKKNAKDCRTLSTLYIKSDTVLNQLVDNFYANLNDLTKVRSLCDQITEYCAGIIKKYKCS